MGNYVADERYRRPMSGWVEPKPWRRRDRGSLYHRSRSGEHSNLGHSNSNTGRRNSSSGHRSCSSNLDSLGRRNHRDTHSRVLLDNSKPTVQFPSYRLGTQFKHPLWDTVREDIYQSASCLTGKGVSHPGMVLALMRDLL